MALKENKIIVVTLIFLLSAILIYIYLHQRSEGEYSQFPQKETLKVSNMKIESPAFGSNQYIPSKYTCEGDNVNPPLRFIGVPESAKSLVLIVDDPDAPMGTWVHWTVWNISPKVQEIPEDSTPEGAVEGVTDFGKPGYGGPCPPSGTHRYFFKLFALDTTLSLDSSARASEVEKAMEGHIIEKAELVGLYER